MPDICVCPCHEDTNIRHIMACCQTCSTCNQRIETMKVQEHKTTCETKK